MRVRELPRPLATVLLVGTAFLVPYAVPSLAKYRFLPEGALSRTFLDPLRGAPRAPLVVFHEKLDLPEVVPPPPAPAPLVVTELVGPPAPVPTRPPAPRGTPPPLGTATIEDPAGVMQTFYAKLARTHRGEPNAVTRITHFGDSPLTGDLISGEARAILQREFGGAGHGFLLVARPWGWYGHQGVSLKAPGWKAASPLLSPGRDGYGLSGVALTGSGKARSEIALEKDAFTRLVLTYAKRPAGGTLVVSVDDGPEKEIPTAASERASASYELDLPAPARRALVRAKGDGDVTVHGIVLEGPGPGIIYDAVGANGASVHFLTLLSSEDWIESLRRRASDLVILNYGTNESGYSGIPGKRYESDYAEVIRRIRAALPEAAILLMAPMDRGMRGEAGEGIVTMPSIPRIVAAQRKVAVENGCAFFDTFTAMGGPGTMGRWYDSDPRLVSGDFTHTTKQGSDRVARLLAKALTEGYGATVSGRRATVVAEARPPATD
ncbi:MAG: hypothetical protein JNK60_04585 [Acidobacteria bacterium]|nr:hypothetical protein [Acidobacteriota bacterium]